MKYLFEFAEYQQELISGPAFGILGDLGDGSQFGEQTGYFKQLLDNCKELGIDSFVFTDFTPSECTAWTSTPNGWLQSTRELPTVFYDRSFSKKRAAGEMSNTRFLTGLGCTPLNSADFRKVALDKFLMYEHLLNEDLGELGLPHTQKYSRSGLVPFVQKHKSCIIKPRFGSGGQGIIKITQSPSGYELKYKDYTVNSPEERLLERIDEFRDKMNTRDRAYIMQECIDLPKYNDGVFDIRVIYQRGKRANPLRTGMAVRLAAPNKVTANLHQGGDKALLSSVLGSLFNQDIDGPIAESIRQAAKTVFERLDEKVGPIGEVGIDFLIDQTGRVHLIEVNSLPGRNLFRILPEIREKSIHRPIEYAQYLLSGKKPKIKKAE